jgi:sugar lactone lactonase YvrE
LYASQPALNRIVVYGPNAHEEVVAKNVQASVIAITANSTLYFADAVHKTVGYIDEKRRTRIVYNGGEIALPSGVALSPDQAMLIVTDGQARFSWSFQIAHDGSLVNGEPYYRLEMPEAGWMSGVQRAIEDSTGQVYFATPLGIQFCEANGRVAGILNPPEHGVISDLVFAGKNLDWLYVAEDSKLFRRAVKVSGLMVNAPVKPPPAPL